MRKHPLKHVPLMKFDKPFKGAVYRDGNEEMKGNFLRYFGIHFTAKSFLCVCSA